MPQILDVDQLSTEALLAAAECFEDIEEEERNDTLSQLLEKVIFIEAKKRRGKTLSAVALAWELRERFGRPVIAVGSQLNLKKEFGASSFLSIEDFRDELERISNAAADGITAEEIKKSFEKYGISILDATLIFDEARKLFNKRNPMDKIGQLFADYLMQSAHYHTTNIITAPDEADVDRRVVKQLDWKGRVYHNKYTNIARVRFTAGVETITYEVNGASDAEHVPFYQMYDSWALLGFRQKALTIKQA